MISISQNKSYLEIDELGARVTLKLNEIPILVSVIRGDQKPGSTHPCTPNFGPDRKNIYGLVQHGQTRNQRLNAHKKADTKIVLEHNIIDEGYPQGITFKQEFSLENDRCTIKTTHTNTTKTPIPVLSGEHCYFAAPKSYVGTTLNSTSLTEIISQNTDGVALPFERKNRINIPGMPTIYLEQEGYPFAMIWVGSNKDTQEKDLDYICIEPAEADPNSDYFGLKESYINPGSSRTASVILHL